MVQIKISVAFVLVATAIAPVVASPVSTLKNGSVLYDVIDDYFFLIVYCSAELNAHDDSEMLERSLRVPFRESFFTRRAPVSNGDRDFLGLVVACGGFSG